MKRTIKITLIVLAIIVVLLISASLFLPNMIASSVFESNFGSRYETYAPLARDISEFDGLMVSEYKFTSNNGQRLAGYEYRKSDTEIKGLVVIAHGLGGGGHNSYMDVADYFATNGYVVFAYDATGNDASEGDAVNGLPQGIADLDHELRFIKSREEFNELPIMLFGHSWGAYSVGSVLELHPDIKAAIMVAGFNSSADLLELEGRAVAGDAIEMVLPWLVSYEEKLFGEYSAMSCLDGFAATDAAVMLLHSSDDQEIPKDMSFDVFYAEHKDDPRFTFISYENRGHERVYYSDVSAAYIESFNKEFDKYIASLEGGFTPEAKAEYLTNNVDKKQLYALDHELMDRMVEFYDSHLN